jgi:PAS domain S-box-containing protein
MLAILKRLFGQRPAGPSANQEFLRAARAGQAHAETGLRHSEEEFEQLVAGVRDYAVFLLDQHGNVRTWNAGAERIKGYRPNEIIGQHFSRFYPPDAVSSGWPAHELQVAGVTGRFEDEGWRVRKDGSMFWASVVITTLRDEAGQVRGFLKITRDLTDRKQAEEKLRLSEERFRLLVEGVRDYALFMLDPQGRVASWNAGAERLYGHSPDAILGQHLSSLYTQEAIERRWPDELLRRAAAEGRIEDEGWRLRNDGSQFWANVIISSLRDSSGTLRGFVKVTRDMSERKQAEENARRLAEEEAARKTAEQYAREIEKQREQLHVTLSSIGDGVIVTDQHGRVTFMNPVASGLTGWEQAQGQPLERVFHIINEHTRKTVENPALRALREGHFVGLANHTVLIAKDGRERPIDDCAAPIQLGQDNTIGAVLVFRDISTRRQAETALRESARQFRQLADSMPQIVWTARPDGSIDYLNERWYEFTGFPHDESESENWGAILHPDDRQRAIDTYFGCIKDETAYEIEYRFHDRKTGGYRWFLGRAVPVRDEQGKIVRWYGTCTDIDDTKRAEEKSNFLAEASAQFSELNDPDSTLQKVAGVAVPAFADWCTVDVLDDGGSVRRLAIKHIDPSKVRLAEELIKRYPPRPDATRGLRHVLATGKAEMMEEIPDTLVAEGAQDSEHLRLLQELGLKSYICMPMQSHGRTLGALTFVMAESGRRFTSADLRLAEQLAQRAAIAIENANLYRVLREEDRRKTEFLAVLAHELRNPLAPIRNGLQVMKLAGDNPQQREQARTMMERQLQHLVRLVDDLLDLNRISRGKIQLRKERIALVSVVNIALETCEPLVKEQNDELTVTLPDEPLYVDADKTRLAQVVCNLVSNAVKYSDPGSRIGLIVQREANEAVIGVKDTGVGIPSHLLLKVFDMFMQVDRSLEKTQGGLGIGLTVVKRLVEMHGGKVEARSEGLGKGSEFLIRLPVVQPPAHEQAREGASQPPRQTAHYRILVADDNVDSASSLAMMLTLMGHEVRTAHDGLEAVEAASEFRPDMILLDIGMPKLNGYDACRRIREQPGGKEVAIFALTGWGQEEDKRRSQDAGFNDHLVKPVELAALEKLLTEIGSRFSREP